VEDARLHSADVRAWFRFEDGRALVLEDSRALGVIELLGRRRRSALIESLGLEPLSGEFSCEAFVALARQSRQPAKVFLMNQSRVAGLGNIYAAEALHRARVHPAKPMNRLSARKLAALHKTIVDVLVDAVQSACIAYAGPGRFEARETFTLAAYGREGKPCPACGRLIRRMMQAGRSTYYCPGCQR
jgi:formamidopyrimidine-DNA glycosylase